MASDADVDPSLLVVVIDSNLFLWKIQEKSVNDLLISYHYYIKSLTVFCNGYCLLNPDNQLIVISQHDGNSSIFFPTVQKSLIDCGIEKSAYEAFLSTQNSDSKSSIHKALAQTLAMINKRLIKNPLLQPRVLLTQIARDVSNSYNHIMNSIFSAQKLGVVIDCINFSQKDSTFLQQAAMLTNGIYLRPYDQRALVQLLLTHFLSSAHLRTHLVIPAQKTVDYSASCFCHQKPVEFAYMCSVCLALTCELNEAEGCQTCGSKKKVTS